MISDFIGEIPEGWWIAIGTLLGGLVLKGFDKWLHREDNARVISKTYREEITELNERIDHLYEEVERWRKEAHAAQSEIATLRAKLITAGIDISEE